MFTRVLRLVSGPATPPAQVDRVRLRAAMAAREEAQRQIIEAAEGSERARQAIIDAQTAEQEAAAAEALCIACAREWAARGARGDLDSESDLYAKAEAARSKAHRARLAAKGAENALRQRIWNDRLNRSEAVSMTQSELDARKSLENASGEVNRAVTAILTTEVAPAARRAAELHAELVQLLPSLAGFARLSMYNFPCNPDASAIPDDVQVLVQKLGNFSDSDLAELTNAWLSFAQKLLQDPEAQFVDVTLRRIPA